MQLPSGRVDGLAASPGAQDPKLLMDRERRLRDVRHQRDHVDRSGRVTMPRQWRLGMIHGDRLGMPGAAMPSFVAVPARRNFTAVRRDPDASSTVNTLDDMKFYSLR